ncbi:MAG: 50S ribosomal protein L30 [Candidatus Eisenbacteria bacterium]|uniref:50S ribosomal protein L30 n=1 Tax=Eiseniibacteriota bacterium TaxID=2212470 RepID=A0A9D6QI66_UNCEI|nr:50S ribosomal protein L30 [Candidatus Eisenbacteria bacterium]MBI3538942.1 50S ribosomal protein L30 [Candidatus Eisenbacteria bacterium]
MARRLRIRQIKSASGHRFDQAATVRALGIRRMNAAVEHNDTPQIRGMIFKVRHLVEVDELGR